MISKYKYLFYFIFGLFSFIFLQFISWLFFKSDLTNFRNEKIFFFFSPPYFLIIVFLAIIAFIIFSLYEIKKEKGPLIVVSLSLILGGGLSNFADRILKGAVADYFDLYFWRMNLADIFIFVGIFLFFLSFIQKRQKGINF